MTQVAEQLDVLLEQEREEKRLEGLAKERQKAALLRFRIAVGALVLAAIATAVVMYGKRETLRLANELERARTEGAAQFDKLDTCVVSHKMASSEAATCKAALAKEQAEFQRSIAALSNKGSDGEGEKLREMQTLVGSYAGRLRSCEEGATASQKQHVEDTNRLVALAEKEKGELGAARDEQKALAEAREKELTALKAERETCYAERSAAVEAKNACIDQKAQILIACAGPAPARPAGTAPAAGTGTASAAGRRRHRQARRRRPRPPRRQRRRPSPPRPRPRRPLPTPADSGTRAGSGADVKGLNTA